MMNSHAFGQSEYHKPLHALRHKIMSCLGGLAAFSFMLIATARNRAFTKLILSRFYLHYVPYLQLSCH